MRLVSEWRRYIPHPIHLDICHIPTGQEGKYKLSGKTLLSDQGTILVSIDINAEGIGKCSINCENTILASMLLKTIVGELIKD